MGSMEFRGIGLDPLKKDREKKVEAGS